jgi:ketosteroid isomerase-like protein
VRGYDPYITTPEGQMTSHPNFDRAQAALDAMRRGDYTPAFDSLTDDVIMENGPGAGPWHRARGKDDLALLQMEFFAALGDTFNQDGRCVYADDRVAISLIRETGIASGGDRFDNLAVYINRLRPDGQTDRVWTVDLDAEHCEAFWAKNPGTPSKDFA